MRAKEYLWQIEKIDKMIENKNYEVNKWKYIALGTTAPIAERVQGSGKKQKMADAVCRYVDIQCTDIDKLIKRKQEIIHTIEQLPPMEYDILHKVYIQFKSLKVAAAEIGGSYSQIATKHGTALKKVQRIIDRKENNNEQCNKKTDEESK